MSKKTRYAAKRDDPNGAIIAMPHYVLNSEAYKTLSGNEIRLLYDIGMQYNGNNNGALLASFRYMNQKRGWNSASSLNRAIKTLEERHLIVKTVQGHLPNKASWYAVGWASLDKLPNLDIKAQSFPRGQYAHWEPTAESRLTRRMPERVNLISDKKLSRFNVNSSCPTKGLIKT
jgi:hypothetical protein